jgi:hypothetical protein
MATAALNLRAVCNDGTRDTLIWASEGLSIANTVGNGGKLETVSLAAAFNALSPPTGATLALIRWVSGTGTWTLKSVTGDAGIAMGTPSATSPPVCVPLSSASIGITASATGEAEVLWL